MPFLGSARSHWPVVAWIRLRLPEREAPRMLTQGPPPPLDPPLDVLERNPVATDPRKQVYHVEEERGETVFRLIWDADDPGLLEAEMRTSAWGKRPTAAEVRALWDWVKETVRPIGPLPVEAADPMP